MGTHCTVKRARRMGRHYSDECFLKKVKMNVSLFRCFAVLSEKSSGILRSRGALNKTGRG